MENMRFRIPISNWCAVIMLTGVFLPVFTEAVPPDTVANAQPEAGFDTFYSGAHDTNLSPYPVKASPAHDSESIAAVRDLKKFPELGGDAVKILQASPGFSSLEFGSSPLIARGSTSTRCFLDGVTLPALFHPWFLSAYNADAVESVELYPGGFGTRYGGTTGGVIELRGKRPDVGRLHGFAAGNLFEASFMVEGSLSRNVSFLATARKSYAEHMSSFLNKVNQRDEFSDRPFYSDYIARLDADVSDNQHCFLTLFGSQDRREITADNLRGGSAAGDEDADRMKSGMSFTLGIFGWTWNINNRMKNDMRYAACYLKENLSVFGYIKEGGAAWEHSVRDQFSWEHSDRVTWNIGLDMLVVPYNLELALPDASSRILRDTSHYIIGPTGVYVSAEWKPVDRLQLIPGIRFDYYPELNQKGSIVPEVFDYTTIKNRQGIMGTEPSVRLSSKYELEKNHIIKAVIGTYNQTPQPRGTAVDPVWGNPELHAEKGSQYVVGYAWEISRLIGMDVQAYYNRQWDVARTPSSVEMMEAALRGEASPAYLGNGKARMEGLEVLIKHEQGGRFFGRASYSLSRSERWNFNENKWAVFGEDRTHHVQFVGSVRFKGRQEAGVRLEYATGEPVTPVLGADYFDATNRAYVPVYGPEYSARSESYMSIDLRYEIKVIVKPLQLTAYLDVRNVENLFGKHHGSRWNYDYTEKIANAMISDGARPSAGLKIGF